MNALISSIRIFIEGWLNKWESSKENDLNIFINTLNKKEIVF